jgi:hypothetical protein
MGKKYWAKRDERLVAESLCLETPADPFKTLHVSKKDKNQLQPKINKLEHYKDRIIKNFSKSPDQQLGSGVSKRYQRFTEEMGSQGKKNKRLFDQLPLARMTHADI